MAAVIGYARASSASNEMGLDMQLHALHDRGCDRVVSEVVSSFFAERPVRAEVIEGLQAGDTLVVTALDRLAQSMVDLNGILREIQGRGAHLRVLTLGLDTADAASPAVIQTLRAVADFEREVARERQFEGLAKAKGNGPFRTRPVTASKHVDEVVRLKAAGKSGTEIAAHLGIGRTTVFRILADPDAARALVAKEEAVSQKRKPSRRTTP